MTSGRFKGHHDGTITVTFLEHEARVLSGLVNELLLLLDEDEPGGETAAPLDPLSALVRLGPSEPPTDAVLARLFPDAYRDDSEAAAEFRRFTEPDLRDGKRANAKIVLRNLSFAGKLTLGEKESYAWLHVLNDLRLALGTRLEVTEDLDQMLADMAEDDPRMPVFAVYEWLAFLQETLVEALQHTAR